MCYEIFNFIGNIDLHAVMADLALLYIQMDSSFWFDTIHLGWSIVYFEGSQGFITK